MKKETRIHITENIIKVIHFLLDREQTIPLSENEVILGELGSASEKSLQKSGGKYYEINLSSEKYGEFSKNELSKSDVDRLLFEMFEYKRKSELREDFAFWSDYAEHMVDETCNVFLRSSL